MNVLKIEVTFPAYASVSMFAIAASVLALSVQHMVGADTTHVMTAVACATIAAFAGWCVAVTSSSRNWLAIGIALAGTWLGWSDLLNDIGQHQAGIPSFVTDGIINTELPFYTGRFFKAVVGTGLFFGGAIWNFITAAGDK